MYRRININNYSVEKWLLQLFLVDLVDYGNALPRKLQLPENVKFIRWRNSKNNEKYKSYEH